MKKSVMLVLSVLLVLGMGSVALAGMPDPLRIPVNISVAGHAEWDFDDVNLVEFTWDHGQGDAAQYATGSWTLTCNTDVQCTVTSRGFQNDGVSESLLDDAVVYELFSSHSSWTEADGVQINPGEEQPLGIQDAGLSVPGTWKVTFNPEAIPNWYDVEEGVYQDIVTFTLADA